MALFRRRPTPDQPSDEELATVVDLDGEQVDADGDDATTSPVGHDRSAGPFDESESDLADQEMPRLDLGSLRIPGLDGVGVQVEADPNTQQVRAVTAVGADGAVQLQAFAAPRTESLWDEIRAEMLAELQSTAGAKVLESTGSFGPELRAVVPARSPDGKQVVQPIRFTGIDGPRWFLRAVFLGKAAVEPDPDDVLHTLVRQTIVVRGGEAMAPRDPLPLRLPEPVPAAGEAPDDDEDAQGDEDEAAERYTDLNPFERGPEITEIR